MYSCFFLNEFVFFIFIYLYGFVLYNIFKLEIYKLNDLLKYKEEGKESFYFIFLDMIFI